MFPLAESRTALHDGQKKALHLKKHSYWGNMYIFMQVSGCQWILSQALCLRIGLSRSRGEAVAGKSMVDPHILL